MLHDVWRLVSDEEKEKVTPVCNSEPYITASSWVVGLSLTFACE
jgi:hypothetical protein